MYIQSLKTRDRVYSWEILELQIDCVYMKYNLECTYNATEYRWISYKIKGSSMMIIGPYP